MAFVESWDFVRRFLLVGGLAGTIEKGRQADAVHHTSSSLLDSTLQPLHRHKRIQHDVYQAAPPACVQ